MYCCIKWMHRYCAGVPITHKKLLEQSLDPFRCYICTKLQHATVVEEMRNAIANFTVEVAELRAAIQLTTRSCSVDQVHASSGALQAQNWGFWIEVIRHGDRRIATIQEEDGRGKQPQTNAERGERRTDSARVLE